MIIDAKDLVFGRFATVVAKKALNGEKIDIVNCEQIVISGPKLFVKEEFKRRKAMGAPLIGPYYPRRADMLVRRMIRGMLPMNNDRGKQAFSRIMCHVGVPEEFANQKMETIPEANYSRLKTLKVSRILDLSRQMGARL